MEPLAYKIRPKCLNDIVGQQHLLNADRPLYNMIKNKMVTNMIFYGPSGTGKTTISNILAKSSNKRLYKINATTANIADIKDVIEDSNTMLGSNGIILYIDEIQYFNKKQQQILLEYIETGKITLIASTTENPFSAIFTGILSRCNIFEFKPCDVLDIKKALDRAVDELSILHSEKIVITDEIKSEVSRKSNGDIRKAIGFLEILYINAYRKDGICYIDKMVSENVGIMPYVRFIRDGEGLRDVVSALQKSIRGSDIDASLYYLARLILVGDLTIINRRLLVIASEDIGLAYPSAISIVLSCVDTAERIGLPEAKIPLSQAVIFLASCPKSNSANTAINKVMDDINNGHIYGVPNHIRDAHFNSAENSGEDAYKYPHDYKNNYVKQDYLPRELKGSKYYEAGNNKFESNLQNYWDSVKNK